MSILANILLCPYCGARVSDKGLEKHKASRCPKRPGGPVVNNAARRPKVRRRHGPKPGSIVIDPEIATYLRYMKAQRDSLSD